ncbi:MAG TPA: chloride channel protein [Pseudonocardiaceae bacterium]|nr:chloride channel protein [Pseudonocardiaceae bacterium]
MNTAAESGRRRPRHLGDFTVRPRVLLIIALALPIGAAGAVAAWLLLRLIGLITNLVFYQRIEFELVAPGASDNPAWLMVLAPVAGGLVIGVMARYGSEKIRGHGIPEAIQAILLNRSCVQPRVAVLKPVSAAVSIGTGNPFGAEGPIIMTGGAVGSILAQGLHLTADERKALMVSGAAAGMAATFNAPLASVLLAVELLLFEWRPRSFLPVTAAVAMSTVLRGPLLGTDPIFPMDAAGLHLTGTVDLLCVVVGATGGLLAVLVTRLLYWSEDAYAKLPVHWMWWPAIGGLIVGIGGLFEPRALGVGYDVIDDLLTGQATMSLIVGILVVKSLIWALSLGSGTSGGVLAPVFMIGASAGALQGFLYPPVAPGFWALIGLAAAVGGVMRIPLTGVVFSLELTQAWPALLGVVIASASAFAVSVLLLPRSVLTERLARRGYHLSQEYDVDPLEVLLVHEVMDDDPATVRCDAALPPLDPLFARTVPRVGGTAANPAAPAPVQRLFPVLDHTGALRGAITRGQLATAPAGTIGRTMIADPVVVYSDDTLRAVAGLFAERHITCAPVVDREDPSVLRGLITADHLLDGRLKDLAEEHHRERPLAPGRNGPAGRS